MSILKKVAIIALPIVAVIVVYQLLKNKVPFFAFLP